MDDQNAAREAFHQIVFEPSRQAPFLVRCGKFFDPFSNLTQGNYAEIRRSRIDLINPAELCGIGSFRNPF